MKKAIYYCRVYLISLEFLAILITLLNIIFFEHFFNEVSKSLKPNDELLKWLILLPTGLFIWIVKEGRETLISEKHSAIIVNWPGYWTLKAHIIASLAYALLFTITAAYPWLSEENIKIGKNFILFSHSSIGCLIVAAHLYFAKAKINEILNLET